MSWPGLGGGISTNHFSSPGQRSTCFSTSLISALVRTTPLVYRPLTRCTRGCLPLYVIRPA
jgi:hypothetical protein